MPPEEVEKIQVLTATLEGLMRRLLLIALVSLTSYAQTAADTALTGNRLIVGCAVAVRFMDDPSKLSKDDAFQFAYCLGLVRGVTDALDYTDKISLPKNHNVGQSVRIVQKYLQDHPEELAERDSLLVFTALVKGFPKK
jgi:hypothetical protein